MDEQDSRQRPGVNYFQSVDESPVERVNVSPIGQLEVTY